MDTQNVSDKKQKQNKPEPYEKVSIFTERIRTALRGACCQDTKECLTSAANPVLVAFQLLGIFPVSINKKNCRFRHSWYSVPTLLNLNSMIASLIGSIAVLVLARGMITKFSGTDFYTVSLVMVSQLGATVLVFGVGGISAEKFCKGKCE